MTDNAQTEAFKRFTTSPDGAGDLAFAGKLRDRVMVLRVQEVEGILPWPELQEADRAFITLMRLPRRFRDVETCGCVPGERALALLRGLHAAELLDAVEDNKARALVPVEIRKAIAAQKGEQVVQKKLFANVYRPVVEGLRQPEPVAAPEPPPPPPKPAAPTVPPELTELVAEAEKLQPTLASLDHFAMLGLKRDATDADVKTAYLTLVRKWHPDRVAGVAKLASEKPKLEAIFNAVGEAHTTLQDKPLREAYLKDLARRELAGTKATNRKPVRAEEAKLHAQKGRHLLIKKDFAAAEAAFEMAHSCDPDIHEYRVEQAWAHSLNPAHAEKDRRKDAMEMLRELVKTTRYADTFYKLGLIQRAMGDNEGCERNIRRAVTMDKSHADAAKEVRVFEMRAERARAAAESEREHPQHKEGSLMGKLFNTKKP